MISAIVLATFLKFACNPSLPNPCYSPPLPSSQYFGQRVSRDSIADLDEAMELIRGVGITTLPTLSQEANARMLIKIAQVIFHNPRSYRALPSSPLLPRSNAFSHLVIIRDRLHAPRPRRSCSWAWSCETTE